MTRPIPIFVKFALWTLVVFVLCSRAGGAGGVNAAETIRVVPQFAWPEKGKASPDGALYACLSGDFVLLVDGENAALIWRIDLVRARDVCFSPDGKYLVACGEKEGVLLDLASLDLKRHSWLAGCVAAFSPDSQRIFLIQPAELNAVPERSLLVLDLKLQISAQYPVKVPFPNALEIEPDGKIASIWGFHGRPEMHIPEIGTAEQTIDLESREIVAKFHPLMGRPKAIHERHWDTMPAVDAQQTLRSEFRELFWNEPSGLCVVQWGATVWDIRNARLLNTIGKNGNFHDFAGFRGPAELVGYWTDDTGATSLIRRDLLSGKSTTIRTGFSPKPCPPVSIAPDGQRYALYVSEPPVPVELRRFDKDEKIWSGQGWPSFWSQTGHYFFQGVRGDTGKVTGLNVVTAENGQKQFVDLQELLHAPNQDRDNDLSIWGLASDDENDRAAVGIGNANYGAVMLVDLKTAKVIARLDDLPIWPRALCFISSDCIAVGDEHGELRIWSPSQKKVLWSVPAGRGYEPIVQFCFKKGSRYLVCQRLYRAASVIDLQGKYELRRLPSLFGSDDSSLKAWTVPQLIGDGSAAIETDRSGVLRLTFTKTGETILTYCALPREQWIVYTPDGYWDGSDKLHDFVKFYSGLKQLDAGAAEKLKSRKEIEKALHRLLNPPQ